MEKYNRAVRIHHRNRLRRARQFYWGYGVPHDQVKVKQFISIGVLIYTLESRKGVRRMEPDQLGRVVKNPQNCSCMGCGNGRRYFGKPLSELRLDHSADDQMADYLNSEE